MWRGACRELDVLCGLLIVKFGREHMTEKQAKFVWAFAEEVTKALKWLHKHNIAHLYGLQVKDTFLGVAVVEIY